MSWNDIPGRAAYTWIYDEFLETAPPNARVVEVGVALGKSLAYLARKCIEANRPDIRIYAVDAWAGVARNGEQQALAKPDEDYELFLRMMQENAPEELARVTAVIRKYSVEAARGFEDASLDLVVLDADHTYEAVRFDLAAWVPKIKRGGAIGGDDWEAAYPGVFRAVAERWPAAEIEIRNQDDWGTWRVQL